MCACHSNKKNYYYYYYNYRNMHKGDRTSPEGDAEINTDASFTVQKSMPYKVSVE